MKEKLKNLERDLNLAETSPAERGFDGRFFDKVHEHLNEKIDPIVEEVAGRKEKEKEKEKEKKKIQE
jgi:hypothetical protein